MAKYIERGTNYAYTIERIKDITFTKLRSVAIDFTRRLPSDLSSELYESIQHGVCQLQSEPELNMYLHALGLMHEAKLQHAFEHLPDNFINSPTIEIIDYGCGQAIGTICYADFLRKNGYAQEVRKITLIEPSEMALKRAALHASCFFPNAEIITINKGFDDLVTDDFCISLNIPTLHIFSNVLDLAYDYFNLKSFAYLLRHCIIDENQFICIEPYFDYNEIDEYPYLFFKFLNISDEEISYRKIFPKGAFIKEKDWTCHIVLGESYIPWRKHTSDIKGFDEDGVREKYEAERAAEEQRFEDAYKLYEISAQKGNADVYYQLGEYNYFGKGIEKNEIEAVKWYLKAAENGWNCEQALFRLGECYTSGIGVVKDKFEAIKYYKKATEYGSSEAALVLGKCYLNGEGIEQDYEDAVRYFRRANYRNAEAQFYLGLCYEEGKGVKSIPTEAVKWYRKAAEQGHNEAQFRLGRCFQNGRGVELDFNEAVQWYQKAAEQGNAKAQNNLGICYKTGQGLERNYEKAVIFIRNAAEQGIALSQRNLGDCYAKGQGVEQDQTEAVKWYLKAAEQGLTQAQYKLGFCYAKGRGVEQDYTEAAKWFRKAAEQGLAQAQPALGFCYAKGRGVEQDYTEAAKWFRKAAEQGTAEAQFGLGVCYANGQGVEQDQTEAVNWYRKAAEQGHKSAQFNLGVRYTKGQGVTKDVNEAVRWYIKAAEQGYKPAQEALEKLNLR